MSASKYVRGTMLWVSMAVCCAFAGIANAANYVVNNLGDTGTGTLCAAITLANMTPGKDTITFDLSAYNGLQPPFTLGLQSPLPTITDSVMIVGPGSNTVWVKPADGLTTSFAMFSVNGSNLTVEIQGLSIYRGLATNGGAVGFTGSGSLTLRSCYISENTASTSGGAIYFRGSGDAMLNVIDSTLVSNTAAESGGGIAFIRDSGKATFNLSGTTITQNNIKNPTPGKLGGGVYLAGGTDANAISVSTTSIIGNASNSGGLGGGMYLEGGTGGTLSVVNSTIAGNTASEGGALSLQQLTATLLNCTFTQNLSLAGSTMGTIRTAGTTSLSIKNTIISGNSNGLAFRDLGDTLNATGNNNLVGTGGPFTNGVNANIVGPNDPRLVPLNMLGGMTSVYALKPDSPALDAGSNADAPTTDQRGQPRPADGDNNGVGIADIGAFETQSFIVTNINDSGPGSLRQTIINNNLAGGGFVRFGIPGAGTKRISPATPITTLTRPICIDAWSQGGPAYLGTPVVEIDGGLINNGIGLDIQTSDCIIRGLGISNFLSDTANGYGVSITTRIGNRNWIYGCFIGVGLDGVTERGNARAGVYIGPGANTNTIGTNADGVNDNVEYNVIAGSNKVGLKSGVYIVSNSNIVAGNRIGTNAAGSTAIANGNGVWIDQSSTSNRVGASAGSANPTAERNIISGNAASGVYISASTGSGNYVMGNTIGVNMTGTAAVPNTTGVTIENSANIIVGSEISATRNIISGNTGDGLVFTGTGSSGGLVQGNYIGLNAAGTAALGNTGNGIVLKSGASYTRLGTFGDSSSADPARKNIISGNGGRGVLVQDTNSSHNLIMGNWIGTTAAGTAPVPNAIAGVRIQDAPTNTIGGQGMLRNVISGNSLPPFGNGIELANPGASSNTILNNLIGLAPDAITVLANSGAGVNIANGAKNNTIGSTNSALANIITNNAAGVSVVDGTSVNNAFLGNSIFANMNLGIDLGNNGVTANAAALTVRSGPNNLQNYPVISGVSSTGSVFASLAGKASTDYRVEFFASAQPDGSGFGEGQKPLGGMTVHTTSAGLASGIVFVITPDLTKPYVTATATELAAAGSGFTAGTPLSTSEFAQAKKINNAPTVANGSAATLEDTDVTIALSGNDPDAGTTLSLRITNLPAAGTLLQFGSLTPITAPDTLITDASGRVVFRPAPNAFASSYASFNYTANDSVEDATPASIAVGVSPVADTPSVTSAATSEDVQTTSGLVITRNPADGPEVAYMQVTSISSGSLFLNDGMTQVTEGQFIPYAQANAGLRFTPAAGFYGIGTFQVQASTLNSVAGLGGSLTTAIINVTPSPKAPTISDATTLEDTLSNSGLVIQKNLINGPEVTHFKIVSLSNGQLFLSDGSTPVGVGGFITIAQGGAGLRFMPDTDYFGPVSVQVRASAGATESGVGTDTSTASITVVPVNDRPSFTASSPASVLENSGLISVPSWSTFVAGPANESDQSVLAYIVSNVTNPALFSSPPVISPNGTLNYTLAPNQFGSSQFTVRVQDSGGTANGGVDTSLSQTFTIVVASVNQPPSFTANNPPAVLERSGGASTSFITSFTPGPANESSQSVLAYLVDQVSNPSLFSVAPSIDTTGVLTYTLASSGSGTSTFRVRAQDNGGTAGGGNDTSAPQTFTIVVRPAATCRNVTIDARLTCPSLRVSIADINTTPSTPGPGATQTVTANRDLNTDFKIGDTSVTITVRYSDGLVSSATGKVSVLAGDCNGNGIPDSCEIANGLLTDCNGDGIPDECQCIWDNGAIPTGANAIAANGQLSHLGGTVPYGAKTAEDFYLEPGSIYHIFGFTGGMLTNSLPGLRRAMLEFYTDCDGVPSPTPIRSFSVCTIRSTEPSSIGFDLVTYSFDLCSEDFYLEGGHSYWVSLIGISDNQGIDSSYWVSVTPGPTPDTIIGTSSRRADGINTGQHNIFSYGPWGGTDECCINCSNLAFNLRGEACPVLWDNGPADLDPTTKGGSPSGANMAQFPPPRTADNFVLKPCQDQTVCLIEATIYTTCDPLAAFLELYPASCSSLGASPIFTASAPSFYVPLGDSIVVDGVTYPGYTLYFRVNWTLPGGKTYWLSSGVYSLTSFTARTFFAYAKDCSKACSIQISPGRLGQQPLGSTTWNETTRDYAFRVYAKPPPTASTTTGASGTAATTCRADFNGDGVVSQADIFAFLQAWFAKCH